MNADALLTLARSFMPCRILLTAAEVDLFSRLADGPRTAAEVAAQLRADLRAVTILLDALAALELIAKRDDRYSCPPEHARLLAADSPHTVLPMIQHCASLWRRWTELTGVVRGDPAARARAQAPRDDAGLAAFIGAMHVLGRGPAAEAVALIDPGAARSLLDVGGGSGIYTQAFLEASPHLRGTLFDRPAVIELARARLEAAGLLDRVTLAAGDFDHDELPGGHDLALLSAIIHQNSRAQNVTLYGKVFRALLPGGRVIIRDHVMSPDRTQPSDGAVFAVNMLVGTVGGNVYTLAETAEDLAAAGFVRVRCLRANAGMHCLVEAFRPGKAE